MLVDLKEQKSIEKSSPELSSSGSGSVRSKEMIVNDLLVQRDKYIKLADNHMKHKIFFRKGNTN